MASTNFDERIKNKLEKRIIQPSEDAWNRLENKLDSTKQSKTKPFLFIGLAASIVGVLLVVSQLFNETKTENNTPIIVVTPKTENKKNLNKVIVEDHNKKGNSEILERPKLEVIANSNSVDEVNSKDKEQIVVANNTVSENTNNLEEKNLKPVELKQKALSFEDQKIQDVIAQVQTLKNNNMSITDADVEALLQQAQKEISLEKLYNQKTGIVDAQSLLQDVEADLDKSFRDKVFEALKSNFNIVKTAVAQRNN
ncbi:hypothetical protein V8G69_05615 [Gaetbulibacter sp. M235]|uniref:hypothetical protein n=1 Tax=Gaetbulibacter sp. M235 TaxID=3126510 RepID=UPI00374F75D7